jgi:phospholipase C
MAGNQLSSIQHTVQLMLANRSLDHMLGTAATGQAPGGQPPASS